MTEKNEKTKEEPAYKGHRQRLRSRFLLDEGRSMPDYELLELLLMYELPRQDVKPLSKKLINYYKSLGGVLVTPPEEVALRTGVGINTAILFGVVHACVNKICWEKLENNASPTLKDKKSIIEYCRTRIGHEIEEKLLVIYLDYHGNYIRENVEQSGSVNAVAISPSSIARKALMCGASGIIISHNHPSGDVIPSKSDIDKTRELRNALTTVNITLQDHIIISKTDYYSFREYMPFANL